MATKLIAYDLNSPGQNYDELIEAIKDLGAWWHHLDSTWLVKSTLTCTAIRDALGRHIDSGDELLVVDVTEDARAWKGFSASGSKWLKETWD
ncbi:CRISPR-associated protein Cas2 [Nocardioides sp. MH1]|uniref:CRISPR-associated protein Cas2 n=1 Tax=Nocardioides sp. MH1 TaxID=3242490 RepID=UPI0035205786